MKKSLFIEAVNVTSPDIKFAIPTEDDFRFITEAYEDVQLNGPQAADEHQMTGLATADQGEVDAPIRFMIVAALFGWTSAVKVFKDKCLYYKLTVDQVKATVQAVRAQQQQYLEDMYEKYCAPVKAKVQSKTQLPPTSSTSSSAMNIKVLAQPNTSFCRIVVYDPKYGNPGARRHLYLTKKTNNSYRVSLGGATVTSWYNEPFFESVQQAENFIKNSNGVNTSKNMASFKYCITDKPVTQGTQVIISDLSNCVLINSDCGPAYIHKNNYYCVESLKKEGSFYAKSEA